MSLINDALKKAQRQQTEAQYPPMPGGGGRVAKRGAPMAVQTVVLIVSGCVVLVVFSVIATVFLLNDKKPEPKSVPVATAPITTPTKIDLVVPKIETPVTPISMPPVTLPTPAPTQTPAEKAPVVAATPPAKPATPEKLPEPKPETKPAVQPAATTLATPVAPVTQVEEPPAPRPASPPRKAQVTEEAVHNFLDAIRLTGVRSSGNDSRVLMNDHVYRVNDIVDRSLGLKLTKVETGQLTFTDANGVVYVKSY
jgi:hypothetical protein